jgi:hypothetical protein
MAVRAPMNSMPGSGFYLFSPKRVVKAQEDTWNQSRVSDVFRIDKINTWLLIYFRNDYFVR